MAEQTPPYRVAGAPIVQSAGGPRDDHVGAELRDARTRMGVSLKIAAADLNIRADYLTALEQNNHSALPELPYAIGFVRSYASYVGLDPVKLSRRFREESGRSPGSQDYVWLKPIDQGRFSGTALLLFSLAIAGAVYTGWYFRTADLRKPAAAVDIAGFQRSAPGDVAAADRIGGTAPPERTAAAGSPPSALPERSVEGGADVKQGGEAAALPEEPALGAAERADGGTDNGPNASGEDPVPDPEPASAAADRTIILKARGLVWIRVRDPRTGKVIVEGIMKEGNQVTVPDDPGLVLDVGRANQLEYVIGSKPAGFAGPTAAVRYSLTLDPAKLLRSAAVVADREEEAESDGDRAAAGNSVSPASEEPPAAADSAIVLKARGLVWIRVRHPQTRRVVVEGIMKKGNVVTVPDDPGLVLDVGRANQLEYVIGGKPAGIAGESPGPIHNLSLDPVRLKRGR